MSHRLIVSSLVAVVVLLYTPIFLVQAQDLPEYFVAYSPDGSLVAIHEKGDIRILDRYSGTVLNELPTLTWGRSIASPRWSPDGSLLAIENGPELQIWGNLNVPGGRYLHASFQADDRIYSMTWNPNGQEIATAAHTIQIHNLGTGFTRTLSHFKGVLWDIAWSPDGSLIASGGEDNTATLWDVAAGGIVQEMVLIRDMNLPPSDVFLDATAVAWSPDGTQLVVGGEDGSLRLWDLHRETEREFGTSQGSPGVVMVHPAGSVVSVTWNPSGEVIASSSLLGTVAVQDARDLHSIAFFDTGVSTSVSWDPVSGNLGIANQNTPFEEVVILTPTPTLTPTNTPTETPLPTSTFTPEPTATETPVPTPSPTLTPTPTETASPTPSNTSSPTLTPTFTPTDTPTPTSPVSGGPNQILFATSPNGATEFDIYRINPDGTNLIRLTNIAGNDAFASWSPDGSRIVFHSIRDGDFEIFTMGPDGGNPVQLTSNSASDQYPAFSPDGTKIAFASNRDGNWELYVMNADGSNPLRLTSQSADDLYPAWSPDGTQIAFVSRRDGNYELYAINADGSNPVRLTSHSADDLYPNWSPDGARIAFMSNRSGALNYDIFAMNADGTNVQRVTTYASSDEYPNWSPDGSEIVFASARSSFFGLYLEIHVMNADGTNVRRLTSGSDYDRFPVWGYP